MLKPFLAEFKTYVFDESMTQASERIRVWVALARGAGFEPGGGTTKAVQPGELPPGAAEALARANAKNSAVASDFARRRAVAAIASHLEDDLERAGVVVDCIEHGNGGLATTVAQALGNARKPAEVPS